MPLRRMILAAMAVAMLGSAPGARAADPVTYTVVPSDTDAAILDTPSPNPGTRGNHLVWLPPEARRVGKLLVFLPTGGATNVPTEFTELGTVAARLGYHTIILAYRNEAPIAALPTAPAPGCGPDVLPNPPGSTCARDMRREILDGGGESPIVNIDRANSIENRLNKLLVYLKDNHPGEGWEKFVDPNGGDPQPVWSQTVIAGSSLGAGEAAIIAERHDVFRAALLHGWVDASHGWVKRDATPTEHYYTLIHARDRFFDRTCPAYKEFGLTTSCHPLPGFAIPAVPFDPNPLLFENGPPPFGTHMFVFNLEPGATDGGGDIYHQSTSRNHWIAKEPDGITPSHILVNAWRIVLGDDRDGDTYLDLADNCLQVPNAAPSPDVKQTDTDHDGAGDVCDPTPRGTTPPTIAVPAGITADATGPTGALVQFTATATDDLDPDPPVTCAPVSGSVFAIGVTTVNCSATDAGNNTAHANFAVSVAGAPEQLGRLVTKVGGTPALAALFASLDPSRPLQRLVACVTLRAFIVLVPHLAPTHATDWLADANRIRTVLAC